MSVEERLQQMGRTLPASPAPVGNYVPAVRTGNLVFLSGVLPRRADGSLVTGRVGVDVTLEAAREAAALCALSLLANLRDAVGDLERVTRVVKVTGLVSCAADFQDHPAVVNGCSDLLAEAFGEAGRHARAAVGVGSLPLGAAVEVDMVVEVA